MKHLQGILTLVVAASLLVNSGCATILHGTHDDVSVGSEPSGSEVYIGGVLMGKTPLHLKLETNREYTLELRRPGFPPHSITLHRSVGPGWVILDVVCGLVPVIVDAVTGAWYSFDDRTVFVQFGETK